MNISLRTTSLLVVTTAFAAACGGNVVLDGSGGGTTGVGGAGGTVNMTTGTTGTSTSTTGTFGTSTSTSSGFGTSTSTSSGFGTSTSTSSGFGTSTTTSSGFGTSTSSGFGTSTSTSSTSSSGVVSQCTQGGDPKAFYNPGLNAILTKCAEQNLNNPGGAGMCIEAATGVSPGCVMCLNDDVTCAEQHCLNMCIPPNTESKACVSCRAASCDPAFVACSGVLAAPGSQTCAGVLGGGPTATPAELGLLPSAFITTAGGTAYQAFMNCACSDAAGCQHICDDQLNGTNTPNYCNGTVASPQCMSCLKTTCDMQLITCNAN